GVDDLSVVDERDGRDRPVTVVAMELVVDREGTRNDVRAVAALLAGFVEAATKFDRNGALIDGDDFCDRGRVKRAVELERPWWPWLLRRFRRRRASRSSAPRIIRLRSALGVLAATRD